MTSSNHGIVRIIYLYLFALVGLFVFIFGAVNGVSAVLDRYVWPQEFVSYQTPEPTSDKKTKDLVVDELHNFEKQQKNDFKRRMNSAIPSVIIGYLLWRFHWREIKRDREN